MQVLIVDDEALARERLRRLLEELPEWEVCGEAGNGGDALRQVERCRPDVVLLDIRMPGMDGLEAAGHLATLQDGPAVIFTTAYGDHALAAFEAHALDYLLKPIRKGRLEQALKKARRMGRNRMGRVWRDAAPGQARSHLCAQFRGSLRLIPVSEIRCFRADSKYVVVCTGEEEILVEDSLRALEREFQGRFLRVHRNALVAMQYVEALEKDRDGQYHVRLKGLDRVVEVSRRMVADVRRQLAGGFR